MDGARLFVNNGMAQSDLDMNGFRIINQDTSNLPPSGIPPSINPPANQWLHAWNSATQTWTATQPGFTSLSGFLTNPQKHNIDQVGTITAGVWNGTQLTPDYVPRLDGIRDPLTNVSMNNFRLVNLADPVNPGDAVNKRFMDLLLQGLNPKGQVRAATRNNQPLAGLYNLAGVNLVEGDRVLVKAQFPNTFDNGIYIAHTGAWTRALDANTPDELTHAYCVVGPEDVFEAGTSWVETNILAAIGTGNPVAFALFSSPASILAGNGLDFDGTILNVVGTPNRIIAGTSVDIASNYVGQASINTVGIITTGTWNATILGSHFGGTGENNGLNHITLECPLNVNNPVLPGSLTFTVHTDCDVIVPTAGTLATLDQPEQFFNKHIAKRVVTTPTTTLPAIDLGTTDIYRITSLASNITSMTTGLLTATALDGDHLEIWIRDDGISHSIIWGAAYVASTALTLPAATIPGKLLYLLFEWNLHENKMVLLSKLENIT